MEILHTLRDTFFSFAGLKLIWDWFRWGYKHFYSERVTISLFVAYQTDKPDQLLYKALYLVAKNNTARKVVLRRFHITSTLKGRLFPIRDKLQMHSEKPLAIIEPGKRFTIIIDYKPDNFMFYMNDAKYIGLETDEGAVYWIKRKQLEAAIREFRQDFPDAKPFEPKPARFYDYAAAKKPSSSKQS